MLNSELINIRYVTDYPKCNYSCVYCIAGHGEVVESRARDWDAKRYLSIVENVAQLPFQVNIRFGVAGEFFLDKNLIKGAAWLSRQNNIVATNLITNLSFKYRHYRRWLSAFDQSKVALVASFHPSEVNNVDEWIDTAQRLASSYDFAVVMVAFPRDFDQLPATAETLRSKGLEVFIQPFIGRWEGSNYPADYTQEQIKILRSEMYSRHDVEFLLNLKKPGMCNAGFRSLYINPQGEVFPCGMGYYPQSLGNLVTSSDVKLASAPSMCMFNQCQCDTENMNTTQFHQNYQFDSINQHKYHYRNAEAALKNFALDEWQIDY